MVFSNTSKISLARARYTTCPPARWHRLICTPVQYKEEIQKALQNVEELNEERGEKINRVKIVEREKAALEVSLSGKRSKRGY
jgi:hypothetical protein